MIMLIICFHIIINFELVLFLQSARLVLFSLPFFSTRAFVISLLVLMFHFTTSLMQMCLELEFGDVEGIKFYGHE